MQSTYTSACRLDSDTCARIQPLAGQCILLLHQYSFWMLRRCEIRQVPCNLLKGNIRHVL